jgi:hypothetical protein
LLDGNFALLAADAPGLVGGEHVSRRVAASASTREIEIAAKVAVIVAPRFMENSRYFRNNLR